MDRLDVLWLMTPPDTPDLDAILAELLRRPAWHREAACRGMGTEEFVIGLGHQYGSHARQCCASCTVREECLSAALADSDLDGMWAGTTPKERREMRRRRAVA